MDSTTIARHIGQQSFVKISRPFPGRTDVLRGFILARSASLLLIQVSHDFTLDGYAIIRRADIGEIKHDKYEKVYKRILIAEGLKSSFGLDAKIALTNWQTAFSGLRRLDYHVTVECEQKEEPDFIIGPIKRISSSKVSVQYYDPAGELENKLSPVKFADITTITFGDNYSVVFRKYLIPPKS